MFPQYTSHKINLARKKGKTPPLIVHRIYLRIRMVPTLSLPQETMVNEKFGISLKGGFCPDRHQSMGRRIYLRRKAMIHHFPISAECTFQLLHCFARQVFFGNIIWRIPKLMVGWCLLFSRAGAHFHAQSSDFELQQLQ